MKLNRNQILCQAVDECMREMYLKSQPSADFDQLVQDIKDGKIDKNERIYERYYLSQDEFKYILNKYKEAYRINKEWVPNIEVLEDYLKLGGNKDKYIPEKIDEDGFKHPGYRGYEKVPSLIEQFKSYLADKYSDKEVASKYAKELANIVLTTISDCKDYYKFDREEDDFNYSIYLGSSPTSNKESVKKWWKENKGIDIEIEDRIPRLFWYYDEGYTDEDLAEEFEDYGPNWKEKLYQEWQDEIKKQKEEQERRIKELQEKYKELKN